MCIGATEVINYHAIKTWLLKHKFTEFHEAFEDISFIDIPLRLLQGLHLVLLMRSLMPM